MIFGLFFWKKIHFEWEISRQLDRNLRPNDRFYRLSYLFAFWSVYLSWESNQLSKLTWMKLDFFETSILTPKYMFFVFFVCNMGVNIASFGNKCVLKSTEIRWMAYSLNLQSGLSRSGWYDLLCWNLYRQIKYKMKKKQKMEKSIAPLNSLHKFYHILELLITEWCSRLMFFLRDINLKWCWKYRKLKTSKMNIILRIFDGTTNGIIIRNAIILNIRKWYI